MNIRHFFAKRNAPEVLEQGPSISKEIGSNSEKSPAKKRSPVLRQEKERLMKNGKQVHGTFEAKLF
jgi:hypothetical protein